MTEAQQKKLTPKQVELVNRALRGDELPLFVGRGREINRRANALSEAREELAERMRAAEGNPAEHELIKAQLQFVAAKLDEYGALEVRPHWFGKGAQQEKKEKAAATKISDMMGIGEDGLKKAIWCLRNSVPITKMNLARDKKYLLEAVKQDMAAEREFFEATNGKVLMLSRWQKPEGDPRAPARGYCAYFAPNDGTVVICSFNPRSKGFITYYTDGTTDALQYPDVRRPKSGAQMEINRNAFESELGRAASWLLQRKEELDGKIRRGEIKA